MMLPSGLIGKTRKKALRAFHGFVIKVRCSLSPFKPALSESRMHLFVVATLFIVAEPPAKNVAWEPAARAKEYSWMSIDAWKKLHAGHLARTKKGDVEIAFL